MKTPSSNTDVWLVKMGDIEDNCDLAVGGLAHELAMLSASDSEPAHDPPGSPCFNDADL